MAMPLCRQMAQAAPTARERIEKMVKHNDKRTFVFIKGTPTEPGCGYSNAVIQILAAYDVDYNHFNVLEDDEIRREIKAYSNWPTIPQVYVDGNFVGGCDILYQMHQDNELEPLFQGNSSGKEDNEKK